MAKVGLKDIAKLANCSVSVASSVLNNGVGNIRYSKEVALRVREAAIELNYRQKANDPEDTLGWVGLALGPSDQPHENLYTKILNNKLSSLLLDNGYEILTLPLLGSELADRVARLRRSGIPLNAIAALHYAPDFNSLDYIKGMGIPYLFLNSGPTNDSNCIILDDEGGCMQAMNFLKACGRKKILYVDANRPYYWCETRRRTAIRECAKHGIEFSDAIPYYELNTETLRNQIKQGVDTIVSISSSYARELMLTLTREGYKIPEDIGIVALDDYSSPWKTSEISLTHISFPLERMAEVAAIELLKMIRSGKYRFENIMLPEHLFIGNTCSITNT